MKRFSLSRLRHLALLTVILISSLPSLAATFTYDGIIYDIIDEKAKTCRTHDGGYQYGTGYCGGNNVKGNLVLPENPNGYKLIAIGSYGFYKCNGLTSVTIPNSVTSIGDKAFSGCSGQISIPNSVSSIGNGVFSDSNATVILANISLTDELESKTWINFTGTIEYRDIRYYYSFNEKYYVLK